MKRTPEYVEGPEAWTRFTNGMRKIITVSHDEIQRRIEAERRESALKLVRPGPKPKKPDGHGPVV